MTVDLGPGLERRTAVVAGCTVSGLVRTGAARTPAVVFDAGLGGFGTYWRLVLDELAHRVPHLTLAAWDRPGLGGSAPDPSVTDAPAVAARWRAALHGWGLNGPWVLVGHSLGGHHVRAFAAARPAEVAGLVMVDTSVRQPPRGPVARGLATAVTRLSARSRLNPQAMLAPLLEALDPDERRTVLAQATSEPYRQAVAAEREHVTVRAQALDLPLPAVPTEVLSGSGRELELLPAPVRAMVRAERYLRHVHAEHARLAAAQGGRWQVVPGSTHHLPVDSAPAVADAVLRVLDQVGAR